VVAEHVARLSYEYTNCAVVVAHPDDETLWAGGTMLLRPETNWTIVTLCRKNDADRAPKFQKALEQYNAAGAMGDFDDGPEQTPLRTVDVEDAIMDLLPSDRYDLVLTHGPWGEYTRHKRHEEVSRAVIALRESERIAAKEVWMFAYEDGGKKYLPRPVADADVYIRLPQDLWQKKYQIITDVYGFAADSFEAKTTPRDEAFWVLGKGK
jgi:LmbE family N-acetylglucosaminyl deacetylase